MTNINLDEAIHKWESEKPLYSQLPIKYKSGAVFNEVEGKCLVCSSPIEKEHLHGLISRPIESVVSVDALGWCQSCNTLTPFFFRVRGENGELVMEWIDNKKGWVRSQSQKGLVDKLMKWLL